MAGQLRITLQTLHVLRILLTDPTSEHYGLEISRDTRLPTGSIYPILTRLETAGWVTSAWEDIDESAAGRRRRRNYRLTDDGMEWARLEVEKEQEFLASAAARSPRQPGRSRPGEAPA
jgi:DNA-binding PadR family transcriptional regulator